MIGQKTGFGALQDLADRFERMSLEVDNTTDKLKKAEIAMSSDIKVKKAAVQVNQDLVDTLADMNNEILRSELRMMGFSEAVVDMMEGAGMLKGKNKEDFLLPNDEMLKQIESFELLAQKSKRLKDALEAQADSADRIKEAVKDLENAGVDYAEGLDNAENKAKRLLETQKAVNFAFSQGKISASNYEQAIKEINDQIMQLDPVQKAMTETIDAAVSSATDNFSQMISGMKSFAEGFKDIFKKL